MTRILVPLAAGCEEMEAVILIDVFRRAGWEVVAAGLVPGPVVASRGVRLLPDATWEAVEGEAFDVLAIPGGAPGVKALRADARVIEAVRRFAREGRWIVAVCAGPLALDDAGILDGRRFTCHPSVVSDVLSGTHVDEPVVVDGRVLTSQGPGTTMRFALSVVAAIEGDEVANRLARALVLNEAGLSHP